MMYSMLLFSLLYIFKVSLMLVGREVIQEDAEGSLQSVVDEITQRTKRRRWVHVYVHI